MAAHKGSWASESHLVVVQWAPKKLEEKDLKEFIEAKTRISVTIHVGSKPNVALIQFPDENKQNVDFLKRTWTEPSIWNIKDIYGIPPTETVFVENLPKSGVETRDVYRFFSNNLNTANITFQPHIEKDHFNATEGWCLMTVHPSKEYSDVTKLIENHKKFKRFRGDHQLSIRRYYAPLEDLLNKTVIIEREVIIGGIEALKYEFMKDYQRKEITHIFKSAHAQIKWSTDSFRVQIVYQPSSGVSCDASWSGRIKDKFSEIVNSIRIENKIFEFSTWEKALEVKCDFDGFLTVEDTNSYVLTIVGYDTELMQMFLRRLDDIKPPPKQLTKERHIEPYKLLAFERFRLDRKLGSTCNVQVTIDKPGQKLIVKGNEFSVNSANEKIITYLLQIHVSRYDINKDYCSILSTDMMKDTMKAEDCLAWVENGNLVVITQGSDTADDTYARIIGLIKEDEIRIEGSIQSKETVEKTVKEIEKENQPLLKLSWKTEKGKVVVKYICPKDYDVESVEEDIRSRVLVNLVREEDIVVSQKCIDYLIRKKLLDKIKGEMKRKGIDMNCLKADDEANRLKVFANTKEREQVKQIVSDSCQDINISWMRIEEEGIDVYFNQDQNGGVQDVENIQSENTCSIRIATINEMKERNIHCIAMLETGQAIFAGTGNLTLLQLPIDVVVNISNEDLEHRRGLAKELCKAGGKTIQTECRAYIKERGKLNAGDVFVGRSGKLNCLRLAHAVCQRWITENSGDCEDLENIIQNVLQAISKEKHSVLKSIAFPLIGFGVFQRKDAARKMLTTLKKRIRDFKGIREVFIIDIDPAVVRTIQDEMQIVFGERCYHLPVENVRVGRGTMLTTVGKHHERKGERIIPLPGHKRILVAWGQIEAINADVIVNPTISSPNPSGEIIKALHRAAGVVFDLNKQCQDAFNKKGNVSDGTLVTTMSGKLPCSQIYHIKIAAWDDNTGEQNVCDYIRTCLQEAMSGKYKSISFPTIGTYDFNYDAAKVTRAFFRTVADFMKFHINCSLERIKFVIHKTDIVGTATVETIIESIFSQRPHRLESVIEETIDEEKGGDNDGNGQQINNNVQPVDGSGRFKINAFVTLHLETGYIEKSTDDVIVCTTSSFPKLNGAIAEAIKNTGGPQIQASCHNLYKNYPDSNIANVPGCKLGCQKVYFLRFEEYKKPAHGQKIYLDVKRCLEKADADAFQSITFPTIGTGGFKYPDITAATKTFDAIQDFFKRPKSTITSVRIVMYQKANMTIQTFMAQAGRYFTLHQAPPVMKQQEKQQQQQQQQQQDLGNADDKKTNQQPDDYWSVPKSKTRVEISFGNLEKSRADVILNTTTSFPNLNGIIPQSLIRVAGQELQKECADYPDKVAVGEIVQTKGYKLQCQNVFHFVLPTWESSKGEKMIRDKVEDCLHLMKRSNLHSIALPSIGTGGYLYDAHKVASGVYGAVRQFGEQCPGYDCLVKLVLYPAAKDVNKAFTDALKEAQSNVKPKKGVKFADEEDYDSGPPVRKRKIKDFVLFQIVSGDPDIEQSVCKDIKNKVEQEKREAKIEMKKETTFDDTEILSRKENQKLILGIGEGYCTNIEINTQSKRVVLKGIGQNVNKCFDKVLDEIRELRYLEGQKKVGHVVHKIHYHGTETTETEPMALPSKSSGALPAMCGSVSGSRIFGQKQYLEWCYTEDEGRLWVPYPRQIAYILEDAYKQNQNEVTFKDTDDKSYVVNFKLMTENIKGSKDKKTSVDVIRKDLATGGIEALPLTWTAMGETENLKEVILKPTDQEYKNVEAEFSRTIAPFNVTQIVKIKRIQNQALYQQYATKKKQFESDLKGMSDIERTLWHGIKADTEGYITSNGFNRGFAAGNLWYGQGTYFAVNSSYSAGDAYSPMGPDGNKRVYLVKVLTGNTMAVARGYSERFAPLVPGSDIIRYSSVCNDVNNPEEFVIFSDTQAYPEYMIYFK